VANVAKKFSQTHQHNALPKLFRVAAITGAEATIRFYLNRDSDVNAIDEKGRSPLILAASRGNVEICRILLEAGANPSLKDTDGNDALTTSINYGHKEVEAVIKSHVDAFSNVELVVEEIETTVSGVPCRFAIKEDSVLSVDKMNDPVLDDGIFDLSVWDEDTDTAPPLDDPSCLSSAKETQNLMSCHIPINTDEDWLDVDIELPESYAPWKHKSMEENAPWFVSAKKIILTGLRNKRVTEQQIANVVILLREEEYLSELELETVLRVVFEDLGVRVEDFIDTAAMLDEVEYESSEDGGFTVDEALNFFEDLLSQNNDPLFHYYRDINSKKIISREEEINLVREMREGVREAFGAIIRSTAALTEIREEIDLIEDGGVSFKSLFNGSTGNEDGDQILQDNEKPFTVIPQHILDKISSVHILLSKITSGQLVDGASDLHKILGNELFALDLSNEFVSRLWERIEMNEFDSEAYKVMESGLAKTRAAKQKFVEANYKFVLWLAKKYNGLPYMDLVQEGNIGLLKAIDRFEPRHEVKFSTYSGWWIRQTIARSIDDSKRLIRVPVHMIESMRRVEKVSDSTLTRTGYLPAVDELSDMLDLSILQVQRILTIPDDPISIDTIIASAGLSLVECVGDTFSPSPEDVAMDLDLRNKVKEMVDNLNKQEVEVIQLRYGLDTNTEHTLEEIGQVLGLTRERIRQIEAKALKKLARPKYSGELSCYLSLDIRPKGLGLW